MQSSTLNQHIFFSAQSTTANSDWYPLDWRHPMSSIEDRVIEGVVSGSVQDCTIQVTTENPVSAQDNSVTVTDVTAFSATFYHVFQTKASHVRVAVASSNGTWNVKGIV